MPPEPGTHHLQERTDSCMAACLCMVLTRAGQPQSEASLRARLGAPPLGLHRATAFGEYRFLDPDQPADIEFLMAALGQGWCLVEVRGGPAAYNANQHGLSSPHGPLAVPMNGQPLKFTARPHHVIVLIDQTEQTYLDPWYRPDGQPISVTLSDFIATFWTGSLLIPS